MVRRRSSLASSLLVLARPWPSPLKLKFGRLSNCPPLNALEMRLLKASGDQVIALPTCLKSPKLHSEFASGWSFLHTVAISACASARMSTPTLLSRPLATRRRSASHGVESGSVTTPVTAANFSSFFNQTSRSSCPAECEIF